MVTWKRPPAGKRYVHFIDVETGGQGDPPIYPVTQIGCVTADWITLEPIDLFEVKIQTNPDDITEEALKVNSFDPEIWEREAVAHVEAADRLDGYLERYSTLEKRSASGSLYWLAEMAGWNAATFDHPALLKLYTQLPDPRGKHAHRFLPIAFDVLDAMHLARWLGKRQTTDHKLETFADHLGIPREPEAHDALAGAQLCLEVVRILRGRVVDTRVALDLLVSEVLRHADPVEGTYTGSAEELQAVITMSHYALRRSDQSAQETCGKPVEDPADGPADGLGGAGLAQGIRSEIRRFSTAFPQPVEYHMERGVSVAPPPSGGPGDGTTKGPSSPYFY